MGKTISLRTDEIDLIREELEIKEKKSTTHRTIKSIINNILIKLNK